MYDIIIIILIILIIIASLHILLYNQNNNSLQRELNELKNKINNDENEEININKIKNNNENNVGPIIPPVDPIANYDRMKLNDPFVDPSQRTSIDQIPGPYFAPYINFPSRGIIDKYHRVGLLTAIDRRDRDHDDIYIDRNINEDSINPVVITPDISNISERQHKRQERRNNRSSNTNNHDNNSNNSNNSSKKNKPNVPYSVQIEPFGNFQGNDILELMGMKLYQNTYKYFTSISEGNKIIKITVKTRNDKELFDGDVVFIPELKQKYRVKIDQIDGVLYNPYFF